MSYIKLLKRFWRLFFWFLLILEVKNRCKVLFCLFLFLGFFLRIVILIIFIDWGFKFLKIFVFKIFVFLGGIIFSVKIWN